MILSKDEISLASSGEWLSEKTSPPASFDSSLIISDSRKVVCGSFFVALNGENFDGHDFILPAEKAGAVAVCASKQKLSEIKGLASLPILSVDGTLTAYQRMARLNRRKSKATLVAITGTCGKTGVKEFLKKIFSEHAGEKSVLATEGNTNNLVGVPLNLLKINDKHQYAVIEMGTNHFGEIEVLSQTAEPDIAIISSIGAGHLEFFKTVEGVAREKSSVFKGLREGGIAIIPDDCEFRKILIEAAKKVNAQIRSFSTKENFNADLTALCLKSSPESSEIEIHWRKEGVKRRILFPVPGRHQISNAAAAALAAHSAGVNIESICSALEKASLSGMRMRKKIIRGITFVNDAYNSNPESAKAGLKWLSESVPRDKRTVVFLGDMLELGENTSSFHYDVLKTALELLPNAVIFTVGPIMLNTGKSLAKKPEKAFNSSEESANFAVKFLKENDFVYLKGSRGMTLEKIESYFEGKCV
jgi:UDP-N-acetylmuramoyl-tripeptide--D-alanyl-D-alanine ligase